MLRDTLLASGTSGVRPWQRNLREHGPRGSNRLPVTVLPARCRAFGDRGDRDTPG